MDDLPSKAFDLMISTTMIVVSLSVAMGGIFVLTQFVAWALGL